MDFREDLAVHSEVYQYIAALHAISSHKRISHFVLKTWHITSVAAVLGLSDQFSVRKFGVSQLTSRLFCLGLSSV